MRRKGRQAVAVSFKKELGRNPGKMLQRIISEDEVAEVCKILHHQWRKRVFTPLVTLWAFLDQILNAGSSCGAAVARVLSYLSVSCGLDASHDPSAYARARKRLPLDLLPRLAALVAGKLAAKVQPHQLWYGLRPRLLDGSTVTLWDSPSNQAAYPQPGSQKPGCGFPVARIVGLFDLVTGAVVNLAMGALSDSEIVLWHRLKFVLTPQDVVVADTYFCSYAEIALLRRQGSHALFRLHQRRSTDWRQGRRLGPHDRRVEWSKGAKPDWMTDRQYAELPDTLTIRLARVRSRRPREHRRPLIIATTLLDSEAFPARAIGELYNRRWDVETDLDHLKTTMQMEVLRTRTPDMVYRELWAHLLAYNLIRTLMWDAGEIRRVDPLRLSYQGAIHEIIALWPFTAAATEGRDMSEYYRALLRGIASHRIPDRPNRREPRVLKRRPKGFPLMTQPRAQYKKDLQRVTALSS